jgi:DNA repair protein SbcC/Rad50
MRPLSLSFSGLRSYPGEASIEFTDRNLVGVIGDTGAGKSTILEAITYALYGQCSWSARSEPLISEAAESMTVEMAFLHEGERWRVQRRQYRNTRPSSHLLENLDTGEQVDNARPVLARVEQLTGLPYKAFQSVVLLQQGRFDRLLNATDTDRGELLGKLFGSESLVRLRESAARRCESLTGLITQAEVRRARLRADPAAEAAVARQEAEQAQADADRLAGLLEQMQKGRAEAAREARRAEEFRREAAVLVRQAVTDARQTTDALGPADAEIAAQDAETGLLIEKARADQDAARERIEQAEAEGCTREALARAEGFLTGLPARLAELTRRQDAIEQQRQRTEVEREAVEAEAAEIAGLRSQAAAKTADAERLAGTAQRVRQAEALLGEVVTDALSSATAVAKNTKLARDAEAEVKAADSALAIARDAAKDADERHAAASARLAEVRRSEAAASAAHGLTAGHDDCPVCARVLPESFEPPAPVDPRALASAEQAERNASGAARKAEADRAVAESRAEQASKTHRERLGEIDEAQVELRGALEVVGGAVNSFTAVVGTSSALKAPDAERWCNELAAGVQALAANGDGQQHTDRRRKELTDRLLTPSRQPIDALATALTDLERAKTELTAQATASEKALASRRKALERDAQRIEEDQRHLATSRAGLDKELGALPAAARDKLPTRAAEADDAAIGRAEDTVRELAARLLRLQRDHDEARDALNTHSAKRTELAARREREIGRPLQDLLTRLNAWNTAAARAGETLAEAAGTSEAVGTSKAVRAFDATAPQIVPAGAEPTISDVARFADAVEQFASQARNALEAASHAADEEISSRIGELRALALQAKADVETLDPGPDDDLLAPQALDGLVAAQAGRHDAAERARREAAEAEAQIATAAALDAALEAGQARFAAVEVVRAQLTEAKFLGHLITRRTRALLAVAGELFGDLTGGRFGFGEDFRIVSLATGTARDPKTLSGGETFLASLALALGLVELHGRGGPRLGALFLDEGFGSLDTASLDTALSVLRGQADGDRLVVVISHLHAVAEAVDDVLWVERGPAGSTARWLDPPQREALIQHEFQAGLL